MTIKDLKELDKLLALCQKRGVTSIKIDNIEMQVAQVYKPTKAAKATVDLGIFDPGTIPMPNMQVPTGVPQPPPEVMKSWDQMTEEEKLFYSADAGQGG